MAYERYRERSKRSWVMIASSIALNALILYIIIQDDIFLNIIYGSLGVLFLLILKNFIFNKIRRRK